MGIDKTEALFRGEASRRDLKRFIKEFWPVIEPSTKFQEGYHVDAIVDHLVHIKDIRNLLINIPPRFGKSSMIAVLWFCWYWATAPQTRFIFSSYSLQLSTRDSIKARRLIESELYQAYYGNYYKLTGDQNTKTKFENSKTGYRLATSVEGSVTGEGGEIIVADDPMNLQEAESKAERDNVIRWFTTVFSSRLNDPATGCRILVMQRCHHEDLSGYLIKNDIQQAWTRLILPLEQGKSKFTSTRWTDQREDGELLCPERIPPSELAFLRQQLGTRAYNSQYNQNPSPPEDSLFSIDDIRFYTDLPEGEPALRIAAVDLAISTKGDYTVIAIADIYRDGSIYLVHLHRERMLGTKIVPTIKALYQVYHPTLVYIEDVAFQRLIIQECRIQQIPVKPVKPEGDKVSRSVMLQVKIENTQFFLPKDRPFNKDILDELSDFPNSTHDDIVDALSYIAIEANLMFRRIPKREETQEEIIKRRESEFERQQEEFRRRVKEDEENYRTRFFGGL